MNEELTGMFNCTCGRQTFGLIESASTHLSFFRTSHAPGQVEAIHTHQSSQKYSTGSVKLISFTMVTKEIKSDSAFSAPRYQ